MDRRADAFLALPGGIGTLEELIEVWVARTLGMHAKQWSSLAPTVCSNRCAISWTGWSRKGLFAGKP